MWKTDGMPKVDTSQWNPKEEKEDGAGKLSDNAMILWEIHTGQKEVNPKVLDSLFYLQAMPGSEIIGLFLGHFYEDHMNDFAKSKMAYQVAANSDSIMGMKCLGDMQAAGRGCEKDLNKAISWYQAAANRCEKTAAFIMGELYRRQNHYMAAYFYSVSFRRGYDPALTRIQQLKDV